MYTNLNIVPRLHPQTLALYHAIKGGEQGYTNPVTEQLHEA